MFIYFFLFFLLQELYFSIFPLMIYLVSIYSFGSWSVDFNNANLFFMWTVNSLEMLFKLYFGINILLVFFLSFTVMLSMMYSAWSTICSWSCFGKANKASPSPAFTYINYYFCIDHVEMSMFTVICLVAKNANRINKLLALQNSTNYTLFHFWSLGQISKSIWFCFVSYFYVPVTHDYKDVLFPKMINVLSLQRHIPLKQLCLHN